MIPSSAQPQQTSPTSPVIISPSVSPSPKSRLPLYLAGGLALLTTIVIVSLKITKLSVTENSQFPTPQEQITVTATDIDISDWKTFTNPTLGVTLQYPSSWSIIADDQNIQDTEVTIKADPIARSPGIEISTFNSQNFISLNNWLAQNDKDCEEMKRLSEKTGGPVECFQYKRLGKRKVNQYASSKILWNCCGSGPTIRYFVETPDKVYFIDLFQDWKNFNLDTNGDYDEDNSKLAEIYQQILSSFQLLPSVEPTDDELVRFVKNRLRITDEFLISIEKIEGNYAWGTASTTADGAGFYWAAAKTNGEWSYAFGGNGIPDCNEVEVFPPTVFDGKFDSCYSGKDLIRRSTGEKL